MAANFMMNAPLESGWSPKDRSGIGRDPAFLELIFACGSLSQLWTGIWLLPSLEIAAS